MSVEVAVTPLGIGGPLRWPGHQKEGEGDVYMIIRNAAGIMKCSGVRGWVGVARLSRVYISWNHPKKKTCTDSYNNDVCVQ